MYIGKYRLPIMSSLLIWAVVWEIAGRTGASFIIPPLSRIFARIIEIVPTAAFGDALWITGKAFILGNIIAIGIGVPLALFFMFEKWFLVPLHKGPIERLLGF